MTIIMPPATRFTTPVIKRSLNPTFPPGQSTFDFPIYLSLAGVIGGRGLEAVMWDKVKKTGGSCFQKLTRTRTCCARSTWVNYSLALISGSVVVPSISGTMT